MGQPKVEICEVGPRDGLQSEKRHWSVDERIEFIDRLSATGVKRMEAVSFVNPKRVPQMADAEAVMAGITRAPGVCYAGLALNVRGAERAAAAGVDEIRYVAVASETFSQRNQGSSIEQTLAGFDAVAEIARDAGIRLSPGQARTIQTAVDNGQITDFIELVNILNNVVLTAAQQQVPSEIHADPPSTPSEISLLDLSNYAEQHPVHPPTSSGTHAPHDATVDDSTSK